MRFDDRLKTVMTQPVADAHDRTVRWRQLVDLLSRPHDAIDQALHEAALSMVRSGARSVARPVRAATARSIAGRASDARLIAIFAADRLDVAAPLIAAAVLDSADWKYITEAASSEVAAFIDSIHDKPETPAISAPTASTAPPVETDSTALPVEMDSAGEGPTPSIGAMVARIERLKNRRGSDDSTPEPAPPVPARTEYAAGGPMLFRWECDASGQIGWVDGVPRGALIGRSLPGDEAADRRLIRAFTDRMPFDDAALRIPAKLLEGEWKLSGIPAFSPSDGRFLGYRGIARRDQGIAAITDAAIVSASVADDPDALRETIHEIKTPLNAIIGFAEIIDGQYLGPAHRTYRQRAAEIVTQARILLTAIEDLDFAARMRGAALNGQQTSAHAVINGMAEQLVEQAERRGIDLTLPGQGEAIMLALESQMAERLLGRFVRAVIEAAAPGEQLRLGLAVERGKALIMLTRPASTLHTSNAKLVDPTYQTAAEGEAKLGLGFALRLVRGLVGLARGELRLDAGVLVLVVPLAKP